jgi:hypothetical protein
MGPTGRTCPPPFTIAGQRTGPPGGAEELGSFMKTIGCFGGALPCAAACAA